MRFDDNTLIAYLDGQLPDADYGPLEQALQHDEALRSRLQALADSSQLARRAFDPVLLEPVPPSLIAAIWRAPDPRARSKTPARRSPSACWPGSVCPGTRAWPALASVAVLGLGVVIGWQLLSPCQRLALALREGAPVTDEALALALEVSPSGRVLRTAGWAVEIVASFEAGGRPGTAANSTATAQAARWTNWASPVALPGRGWQARTARRTKTGSIEAGPGPRYQTASDQQHEQADAFLRDRVQRPPLGEEAQEQVT